MHTSAPQAAVGHAAMAGVGTPAFRSASHSSASTSNGRMIAISVDGVVVLAPIGLATRTLCDNLSNGAQRSQGMFEHAAHPVSGQFVMSTDT